MVFSKACEYGIRAMVCIAASSANGERIGSREIAVRTDLPEAFTAKVLQKLVKADLVVSVKGPNGGFELPQKLSRKVKVGDIVDVIDGNGVYMACALGFPKCSDAKPCAIHFQFVEVRRKLRELLEKTSVEDLVNNEARTNF